MSPLCVAGLTSTCATSATYIINRTGGQQQSRSMLMSRRTWTTATRCWSVGLPETFLSRLQRLQNPAAHLVSPDWSTRPHHPALHGLDWLLVKQRAAFKLLVLTYKALHGSAPQYLADLLSSHQPSGSLRSSVSLQITVRRRRLETTVAHVCQPQQEPDNQHFFRNHNDNNGDHRDYCKTTHN